MCTYSVFDGDENENVLWQKIHYFHHSDNDDTNSWVFVDKTKTETVIKLPTKKTLVCIYKCVCYVNKYVNTIDCYQCKMLDAAAAPDLSFLGV